MTKKIFLTARWQYLAMFNYEVDPGILKNYLPPYTEIDLYKGKAFVSVVGFLFNDTKVWGIKWPGHINFEEVNLRFYIKHFDGHQWKRGVGFVSEIVPRPFIAGMANLLYNEQYSTAKMNHHIDQDEKNLHVVYNWKKSNRDWNRLQITAENRLVDMEERSEEEFIFEHYYGYNRYTDSKTIEYSIQHPRWQLYPVIDFDITCEVEHLYGKEFVPFISQMKPHSVFLAKGSEVNVKRPLKIISPVRLL